MQYEIEPSATIVFDPGDAVWVSVPWVPECRAWQDTSTTDLVEPPSTAKPALAGLSKISTDSTRPDGRMTRYPGIAG